MVTFETYDKLVHLDCPIPIMVIFHYLKFVNNVKMSKSNDVVYKARSPPNEHIAIYMTFLPLYSSVLEPLS